MKILVLHGSNDRYGASQVLLTEIEALEKLGNKVNLMVPFDGPLEKMLKARKLDARVTINNHMPVIRRSKPFSLLKVTYGKSQIEAADIVIVWTLALSLYIPTLLFRRKKFYVSIHELAQSRFLKLLVNVQIAPFRFPIQVNSDAVQTWLINNGIDDKRITKCYPSFRQEKLTMKNSLSLDSFGVVGRVNGKKGHLEVAKAFSQQVFSRTKSLHLFGAPFPGQETHLNQLLEFISNDNRIHYHGEVENFQEASKHFSLLLSFPAYMESLGLTPIEAYFQNIRVAGYADGGSNEIFRLVDGIGVHRTSNPIQDIQRFFSNTLCFEDHSKWKPMHFEIARDFSQDQRIRGIDELLNKLVVS